MTWQAWVIATCISPTIALTGWVVITHKMKMLQLAKDTSGKHLIPPLWHWLSKNMRGISEVSSLLQTHQITRNYVTAYLHLFHTHLNHHKSQVLPPVCELHDQSQHCNCHHPMRWSSGSLVDGVCRFIPEIGPGNKAVGCCIVWIITLHSISSGCSWHKASHILVTYDA